MLLYCDINNGRCRALEKQKKHSTTPHVPELAFLLLYIFQSVYITVQRHKRSLYIFEVFV